MPGTWVSPPVGVEAEATCFFSTAPVFLIPLIGFGLLRIQPIGDPGDSVRLLLTTLAMVAGIGILTLRLSFQSGALERADARLRLLAAATEQTADLILITRAGQIVRNLLSFVRRNSPDRSAADLNQIARAAARMREHHLAQRNIALLLELHPGVMTVLVNREEIQQLVLNLVLIAAFAWTIDRFQIAAEEKALAEVFGNRYVAYRGKVRRWI